MNTVDSQSILNALKNVKDPDLGKDLVSLNMIRDLRIEASGHVAFRVVLTTPACPLKAKIEQDCRQAVLAVPGVQQVDLKMDAEVKRPRAVASGSKTEGMKEIAHIIAVSSGKGGVGKSTISVNLATSLALEGARVGLMDADIYGPNIPTMMGITELPKWRHDPDQGDRFLPLIAHQVKVMSMGFLLQPDQPVIWRGPMLHSMIQQFCYQVDWGVLDYLIVDMPPGTGDVQLSLAQLVSLSGSLLVTTPQEVALQDVRKAFYLFEKVRVPVLGIVENMSFFRCDACEKQHTLFGSGGGARLSEKFHAPLLSQVPLVSAIRHCGDTGTPLVIRDPQSEAALELRQLAKKIAQQLALLSEKGLSAWTPGHIGSFGGAP